MRWKMKVIVALLAPCALGLVYALPSGADEEASLVEEAPTPELELERVRQGGCSNAQIRNFQAYCRVEADLRSSSTGLNCYSLGLKYCYGTPDGNVSDFDCAIVCFSDDGRRIGGIMDP